MRSRSETDRYRDTTTELAKLAGEFFNVSPARAEHIVNGYTGNLYRQLAGRLDDAMDLSRIGADGDWSSVPIIGTMFLRQGLYKVATDFYSRRDELRQKHGSKQATLEEIGELRASDSLNREINELWSKRREVLKDGKAKDTKPRARALQDSINEAIKRLGEIPAETHRKRGIGSVLYAATSPGAEPEARAVAGRPGAARDDRRVA